MAFFSKTLDKLKGALRKTAAVLNTDVRTLFIPGRQIDDAFLTEMEERLLQSDMGVRNVDRIVGEVRERWRLGRIRNADEAGRVMREAILGILTKEDTPEARELRAASSGPTVVSGSPSWIFSGRIVKVPARPTTCRATSPVSRFDVPTNPATNAVAGCS